MKTKTESDKGTKTLVLKLSLRYCGGERVVVLPKSMKVDKFYEIVIRIFGFSGGHLGVVKCSDGRESTSFNPHGNFEEDDFGYPEIWHERLEKLFPVRGTKATVEYDFGDGWKIGVTRMADKPEEPPFARLKSNGLNASENCEGQNGLFEIVEDLKDWMAGDAERRTEYLEEDEDGLVNILNQCFDLKSLTGEEAQEFIEGPTAEEITAELTNGVSLY